MAASHISIILCVLIAGICAQVPTVIPFLGTGSVSTPTLSTSSFGQLITKVSDIRSFTFFVLGLANGEAQVSVAKWSTPSTPIKTVSFVLPFAYTFSPIKVNFDVEELDPETVYVVYVTFQSAVKDRLQVATKPTTGGAAGGLVKFINGVWNSKYPEDLVFELSSTNILKLYQPNYSSGRAQGLWACEYTTSYSAIQVNWATNIVNTGYANRSTTTLASTSPSTCPAASSSYVPFGTAAECNGGAAATGKIDIRGTSYKVVVAQFAPAGAGPYGSATYSSNNQVVDLAGGGWCGWIATTTANAAGEDNAIVWGGFYLNLTRV